MARRTHKESVKYWGRIVREHQASGLSIRQFCDDRRIQQTQFYKWRKQLKAADAEPRSASPLLPVTVVGPPPQDDSSRIEVRIDDSVSILVRAGFDPYTLCQAVAALRQSNNRETSTC